ncbi:MAG TPA: hypothetical protein VM658_17465, partial [bacterium]|nr:hypothetical protein [bacterium]
HKSHERFFSAQRRKERKGFCFICTLGEAAFYQPHFRSYWKLGYPAWLFASPWKKRDFALRSLRLCAYKNLFGTRVSFIK